MKPKEDATLFPSLKKPNFKGGLIQPLDSVFRRSNGTFFNIISEPLTTTPVIFYLQKNSYLKNIFSDRVQDMLASGLIYYWINQYNSNIKNNPSTNAPKILTLNELSAIFIITAVLLFLSSVIFITEIILKKCKGFLL